MGVYGLPTGSCADAGVTERELAGRQNLSRSPHPVGPPPWRPMRPPGLARSTPQPLPAFGAHSLGRKISAHAEFRIGTAAGSLLPRAGGSAPPNWPNLKATNGFAISSGASCSNRPQILPTSEAWTTSERAARAWLALWIG